MEVGESNYKEFEEKVKKIQEKVQELEARPIQSVGISQESVQNMATSPVHLLAAQDNQVATSSQLAGSSGQGRGQAPPMYTN